VIFGCLFPREFHFRGNETRALLSTDVCKDSVDKIKMRVAVEMQERITDNVATNRRVAKRLRVVYALAAFAPIISLFVSFLR